jgi:hypothetical protein
MSGIQMAAFGGLFRMKWNGCRAFLMIGRSRAAAMNGKRIGSIAFVITLSVML